MEFLNFKLYVPALPVVTDTESEESKERAALLTALLKNGINFAKDDDGNDWYDVQDLFNSDTFKVMYCASGRIRAIEKDASRMWPDGYSVAEINADKLPDGIKPDGEWVYKDGIVTPRIASQEESMAQFEKKRNSLLSEARQIITEWQAELSLGIISEKDKTSLIVWLNYIRSLKELPQALPDHTSWPQPPAIS